ncbi:uncharacterized protein BDV14DRAFT_194917 [Aspergillus stella-maris]|uniref:uncharacterized protein n=1 Tax=Aspergillus stella-maris TaxID=1810926 RepID=UPI003CCD1C1E
MEIVWLAFICKPLEADELMLPAACAKGITEGFLYFSGISNLVLDLWVFVLPLPTIVKLRVPTRKKIALGCLFSIGAATCATTAARLVCTVCQRSHDLTWDYVPLPICFVWEPVGIILCANLPTTYKPLAAWFRNITGQKSPDTQHQTQERAHIAGIIGTCLPDAEYFATHSIFRRMNALGI